MSWAGPLTLLLLITGSLIELDRENVFLKIEHAPDDVSGVQTDNDDCPLEPIWSDLKEPENCSIFDVTMHGYLEDQNMSIFPIPDDDMKSVYFEEKHNSFLMVPDKPEGELMQNKSQATFVEKCDAATEFEYLTPYSEDLIQLDDITVEDQCVVILKYIDNDTCPLNGEINDAFRPGSGNQKVQMRKPFPVESEHDATALHDPIIEASDDLDSEFVLLDSFEDALDNAYNPIILEDTVLHELDTRDNQPLPNESENAHNSFVADPKTEDGFSIIGEVMNVVYDHGIEPAQACWKESWLKYLRKYIRDIKWVLRNLGLFVKYVTQRLLGLCIKICGTASDYEFYVSVVNVEMFEYIWFSIQNLNLDIKAHGLAMYDVLVDGFSEMYIACGKIRLSIRHFMHDKDFRFNYFWYVFHTTSSSMILILFYLTVKKITFLIGQLFNCVSIVVKKIFTTSKRVSVAVGPDSCDMSLISVKLHVLRNLREVRETEQERLGEIRDLENQLDYARDLARWSNLRTEALVEEMNLLRSSADETSAEGSVEGDQGESSEV